MSVKAKMRVDVNEEVEHGDGGHRVVLHAVVTGSKENKQYFKYTPNAEVKLEILNANAYNQFEIGKEYYVTFEPA